MRHISIRVAGKALPSAGSCSSCAFQSGLVSFCKTFWKMHQELSKWVSSFYLIDQQQNTDAYLLIGVLAICLLTAAVVQRLKNTLFCALAGTLFFLSNKWLKPVFTLSWDPRGTSLGVIIQFLHLPMKDDCKNSLMLFMSVQLLFLHSFTERITLTNEMKNQWWIIPLTIISWWRKT